MLSWRVVSADGHPVGGSVVFSIGAASAAPPAVTEAIDRPVRALWLARLALYLGLFFGVGGAFFLAWIGSVFGRAKVVVLGSLHLGLVAALLSVGLQGLDALDLPLAALAKPAIWDAGFGTSYGSTATAALLALLGAIALDQPALEGGAPAACPAGASRRRLRACGERSRRRRRPRTG